MTMMRIVGMCPHLSMKGRSHAVRFRRPARSFVLCPTKRYLLFVAWKPQNQSLVQPITSLSIASKWFDKEGNKLSEASSSLRLIPEAAHLACILRSLLVLHVRFVSISRGFTKSWVG